MNPIEAVLWDFGGVVTTSPFEAFRRYEQARGLPLDFIRSVNATNIHSNAWARMERGEIGPAEFDTLFRDESTALGHTVDGRDVLPLLSGDVRPKVVAAIRQIRTRYRVACLTNNMSAGHGPAMAQTPERASAIAEVMELFEVVVESSKTGLRKPEPAFYLKACELLGIQPVNAVFLDDLGVNLKPAAALGMRTIKVGDADAALAELGEIIGMNLQ
jgi:putative hydrolase of the HAD superfamily